MISGINGSNSGIYGYQAVLNQYRLTQAMQNRTSAPSKTVQPVSRIPAVDSSLADSISYVKDYSSSMSDLMSSANSLRGSNRAGVTNQMSVSSSDAAVADATNRFRLTDAASYEVNVSQLATAQTNVSDGLSSTAKAASDLSLQITGVKGTSSIQISALDQDGKQKSNSQLLNEAASAVNQSNTGVKASVITKDGKSSLQLQAAATGADNGFTVSGSFAQSGGMANITQAAQDASYTVTSGRKTESFTSGSNKIKLDYGNIEATLKKEGTSTISVGVDPQKTVAAMSDFVDSYNRTVSLLSKNTDKGSGTARQLQALQNYVPGSQEGMDRLGLSFNKDGTLSLDKTKLSDSLKKDPGITKDLISGSSGIAQRAFSTAQSGSTSSISSLIGNSLAEAQYNQNNDPMTFMGAYSRSGVYNMMNMYATGMMLNRFV